MPSADYTTMEEEELVELNNQLSEKRAAAAEEIKGQQLEVNAELSRRQLRKKLQGLSSGELTELGKMIKDAKTELKASEEAAAAVVEEEPQNG